MHLYILIFTSHSVSHTLYLIMPLFSATVYSVSRLSELGIFRYKPGMICILHELRVADVADMRCNKMRDDAMHCAAGRVIIRSLVELGSHLM